MEPWKNNEIKDVNAASALNLKAELLKQNEIFQQERRKYGKSSQSIVRKPINKPSVFSKKNKGIELRKLKDKEDIKTAGSELEASWISLQRKAKLYEEQLNKDIDELDDEELDGNSEKAPLVDFLNKKIENIESLKQKLDEDNQKVEDSWVEYIDEFGRTRLIRKSDMEKYNIKSNENIGQEKNITELTKEQLKEEQEKHLEEELEEIERNEETYFNAKMENRRMGTGYYQFSQNKEERLKQQEALEELRQSTSIQRQKAENLKKARNQRIEERKRKLKERMEKVKRQRKLFDEKRESFDRETEKLLKSLM